MRRAPHTPTRTCMGCGGRDAQANLLRIACGSGGKLEVTGARQHQGRSGYLHPNQECYNRFAARKGPLRSLRRTIDKAARAAFVAELKLPESGVLRG